MSDSIPAVGILVLNYHQPGVTLACVRRLLEREGENARILWLENDAEVTREEVIRFLEASGLPWVEIDGLGTQLPPAGTLGFVAIPENRGYAGGNNVGARLCQRAGATWVWILNNDTLLESGSSEDLRLAAQARPDIGVWGTVVRNPEGQVYSGGRVKLKDFAIEWVRTSEQLETDPMSFVSGCSLFFHLDVGAQVGFLPEEFFLYYEDPAFSAEIRRAGYSASMVPSVKVFHEEAYTTGNRSDLVEFYNRRNRWFFVKKYFPDHLQSQVRRRWYRYQNLIFRGKFRRVWIERMAYRDFLAGRTGKADHCFSRK